MARTYTRHLMPGGSGLVELPYLEAALWRGENGARKARTMRSALPAMQGRTVTIPARKAQAAPKFRPYKPLREIVAGKGRQTPRMAATHAAHAST